MTSIDVEPETIISLAFNGTEQLVATVYDENHIPMNGVTLTWVSDNPSVATVDSTGLVTAVSAGPVNVYAQDPSTMVYSNYAALVVSPDDTPVVTSILVTPDTITNVAFNGTQQLAATVYDQFGFPMTGITLSWVSISPSYVTVDSNGLATAVSTGASNIYALDPLSGVFSNYAALIVGLPTQYTLTYNASTDGLITGNPVQTVSKGGNGTVVTAVPNASCHFVNWSDSSVQNPRTDTNVQGSITVTANFVANNPLVAASVYITPDKATVLSIGGTQQMASLIKNQLGQTMAATPAWSSDNTAVATISVSGFVIAVSPGSANITASYESVTSNYAVVIVSTPSPPVTYTLTYSAGANGLVTGDLVQTVASGGNGTAITAVPNQHYHFTGWSDSSRRIRGRTRMFRGISRLRRILPRTLRFPQA